MPITVVNLQGFIFLGLGFCGYFALGDGMEPDAFNSYAEKYPDKMTDLLQSAILVLVYLSVPLVLTPLKAQIWSSLSRYTDCGEIPLPSAPLLARHGINLCCIAFSVSLPAFLGERDFMKWFTIL